MRLGWGFLFYMLYLHSNKNVFVHSFMLVHFNGCGQMMNKDLLIPVFYWRKLVLFQFSPIEWLLYW